MDYYHNFLQESLAPNFKDIPMNQCIPNASLIEISFTPPRNMITSWDDPNFFDLIQMLGAACNAISKSSEDKWDFYHPQLVYKPPQERGNGVLIARFFGKIKEEKVKQPSDMGTDL